MKFYANYLPSYYQRNKSSLTTEKIIEDIKNGKLFGAVEMDMNVISNKSSEFDEFPPFFATCDVFPMNSIGEHMLDFCKNNDITFEIRRLLISGKQVKKMLLATPLLQWYLSHYCEISKIYQIIEFQPKSSFTSFIDTVTKFQILGDKHPDKAIVWDTYKLLSNSSYDSILINKSKHCNINYMTNRNKIMIKVNSVNGRNNILKKFFILVKH